MDYADFRDLSEYFALLEFLAMESRIDFCTVKVGITASLILAFCLAVPLAAQSPAAQTPAVPDWAQPGSTTHTQVPPPADFHRPTKNFDNADRHLRWPV